MTAMTIAADRRASVRLAPANAETHCWILDWEVERMIAARLLNISLGGAVGAGITGTEMLSQQSGLSRPVKATGSKSR
jgi:hypothetical protein